MVQDVSKIAVALIIFPITWLISLDQHTSALYLVSGARYVLLRSFHSKHLSFIVFCLQLILVSQDRFILSPSYLLNDIFTKLLPQRLWLKSVQFRITIKKNLILVFVVISSETKILAFSYVLNFGKYLMTDKYYWED